MFENLSNKDISNAIDKLITHLGVKEEISFSDLLVMLQKKDVQGCVQEIAIQLGLPIRISLSYVSKDFKPHASKDVKSNNTDVFRTSALARTDWTGHGIESITAQVSIPPHLPMFGSSSLQGYPIQVRVSENCHEHPATFVAIMAHEISHVLLASLWLSEKDSELHTDLVPIVLGFCNAVQIGRKNIQSTTSGNMTTTRTTTYGYLTDKQFDFACNYVMSILGAHKRKKDHLIKLVEKSHRKLCMTTKYLARFRNYLRYLDTHPPKKMKQDDAMRAVQFHAQNYTRNWEIGITQAQTNIETIRRFVQFMNHYTNSMRC